MIMNDVTKNRAIGKRFLRAAAKMEVSRIFLFSFFCNNDATPDQAAIGIRLYCTSVRYSAPLTRGSRCGNFRTKIFGFLKDASIVVHYMHIVNHHPEWILCKIVFL